MFSNRLSSFLLKLDNARDNHAKAQMIPDKTAAINSGDIYLPSFSILKGFTN